MKYTVSKRFSFEAAHSLPHLPEGHKCRNLHGHSYVVEVFCTGPVDERGFVVDYAEISAAMKPLIDRLDHQNLNEVFTADVFSNNTFGERTMIIHTTAENLAWWFMDSLSSTLPLITAVQVYETAKTCVRVER